ncbi:MAG: 3'-5' exonuclease [Acidimicrobiales bacterium]|nr:3'-5' exonuclease [Acidimicrobiales bacterium]
MRRRPTVYGLDIETDTTENGLDPAVARVVTVALASPGYEETFTGPEHELLGELDQRLGQLEPGVIATWNGAAFDLPFIADRAALYGMHLGLHLQLDPSITLRRSPLPGHEGAYRARWYRHDHVDAYLLYRGDVGPSLRISCSLKSIARLVGLAPVEVDRSRIHDLSNEALHAYAASDARLARILTERRWATAARFVDKLVTPAPAPPAPVTRRALHAISA